MWNLTNNESNFLKKLELNTSLEIFNLERIRNTIPDSSIDLEKDKCFILNYNFDSLHAVSFQKGCYIGQENTSRQNYRRKIKYKLKTLELIEGVFPKLNEEIVVDEKKIGIMKSSVSKYALALLRSDFSCQNKIFSIKDYQSKIKLIWGCF